MSFKPYVLMFLLLSSVYSSAQAELYIEVSAEAGGDELIATNSSDNITAGGGIKFAIGVQTPLDYYETTSIRLAAGYLSDSILAYNGRANFDTVTFDAMLLSHYRPHSFGVGLTLHMSPRYSDYVDGYEPEVIDYDDAVGLVFQYSYQFVPGVELGFRFTELNYKSGAIHHDAGSVGIYLSNGF